MNLRNKSKTNRPPKSEYSIFIVQKQIVIPNVKSFASARALILWYLGPGNYLICEKHTESLYRIVVEERPKQ